MPERLTQKLKFLEQRIEKLHEENKKLRADIEALGRILEYLSSYLK